METFNAMLHSVRREADERREHLDIFREFLGHLGRSARRGGGDSKPNDRRGARP